MKGIYDATRSLVRRLDDMRRQKLLRNQGIEGRLTYLEGGREKVRHVVNHEKKEKRVMEYENWKEEGSNKIQ